MRNMTPEESKMLAEFVRSEMADGEAFVRSSAWVGEAEAALAHLAKAREQAPDWKENYVADKELYLAEKCIRCAIASERRPSPTAAGERQPAKDAR